MSRQFLPGTPPIVREAADVVSRYESGAFFLIGLWAVLFPGALLGGGGVALINDGAVGWLWLLGAGAGVAVLAAITRYLMRDMPSTSALEDARAVLKAWESQRADWAQQAVANSIDELAEADPDLVRAWEEGREGSLTDRMRTRRATLQQ